MAAHHNQVFVMAALLLLAAATPLARGQRLDVANIIGQFCCSPTGTCNGTTSGIPGAMVTVNCTNLLGVTVTVGNGTTDVNGNFNVTVPNIGNTAGSVVNGVVPCVALVKLPLNQTLCTIQNTVFAGIPVLISTLLSPVFGLIGTLRVSLFAIVLLR